MTLNFASFSPFAPFRALIRSDDDFGSMGWLNLEVNDLYDTGCGRDWTDPIDLLPADPFGMELSSNLAVAIVGLFEDLGVSSSECKPYCSNGDYESGSSAWLDDGLFGFQDDAFVSAVGEEEILETLDSKGHVEGHPHDSFILSLGFLGVEDLLSVERVCTSLRSAVQNDPLLWRCIHIDFPLSDKIMDDALFRLTLRGQGSLRCLSLAGCSKITDDGLRLVLESNPMLQKLSVAECARLSMDGLINNLKAFKSSGLTGIKNLKLGRLFSVSPEHYEELRLLLGEEKMKQPKPSKPRFYHCSNVSDIPCDDDGAIDIEMCLRCEKFKLVFDCPLESCREKGPENCRACEVCIGRCVQCGKCINDCMFEETFCLRYLCSNCWQQERRELPSAYIIEDDALGCETCAQDIEILGVGM